jgi:NSS family neurotransmitter:Na+ symporter
MEVVTLYIHEEYRFTRKRSALLVTAGVILLGTGSSFSSGCFTLMDVASAKFMLPLGGLFISLFVGWYLDRKLVVAKITNEGSLQIGIGFLKLYIFLLRYIAPLAILAIFLYGLTG